MDAVQEIKQLLEFIDEAAHLEETGDEELPPFRRRKRPTQEEPTQEEEQEIPPRPLAWPTWLVPSRRTAIAAAVLLAGITLIAGVTAGISSRRGNAVPVEFEARARRSSRFSVQRVNSDGAIPNPHGKRLRRTMADVELELLERKLRRAIEADGLIVPELDDLSPSESPSPEGEGDEEPRSRPVRVAKARL